MSDLYTIELNDTVENWTVELIENPSIPPGGDSGQILTKASAADFDVDWGTPPNWQVAIDTAVASLVDASPAALDTLNELAAALGDDPHFATTITNLIAAKYGAGSSIEITGLSNTGPNTFGGASTWSYGGTAAATHRAALGLAAMALQDPANVAITGGTLAGLTDLRIRNKGTGVFDLIIAASTTMTGTKQFLLALGDVNRTLTMTGNATLNQDVSTAGSPAFVAVRITGAAPAAATAAGTAGTVLVDANYLYACTATNTWKRVLLSTWP